MQERVVSSIFTDVTNFIQALKRLKEAGLQIIAVHSPVGLPELEEYFPRQGSPVRFVTLLAGITGAIVAFWMCVGSALIYKLIVGGKHPADFLPYFVIIFEFTVLLGGLATLAALIYFARPWRYRGHYDPRYSEDRFGVSVKCAENDVPKAVEILRDTGAEEINQQ